MHSPLISRMAKQKDLVLQLASELSQAATSEDQIRLRKQLQEESLQLSRMIIGFRRRKSRGPGRMATREVSPEQVKARIQVILQRAEQIREAIDQVAKTWAENKGNAAVRRNLQARYQSLMAERVHLHRRMMLLREGRDYLLPRPLAAHQVRVARKRLNLPPVIATPTVNETGALVGLLVTRIQRRKEDTDDTFRERLVSYLRRALVRWSNRKAAQAPADEAVVGAVAETLSEDSAALEAEADAGGSVQDPVADVFGPLVDSEAVQEQVDGAIDNLQPTVVQDVDPGEAVVEAESLILEEGAGSQNLGFSSITPDIQAATVTTQAVDLSVLAPSPEAAYYPGTVQTTQAPLPTITTTTAPSKPSRKKTRRGGIYVPRVPTFSKASGSTQAVPSSAAPSPTLSLPSAPDDAVITPTLVDETPVASPEPPKDNKLLLIGVGVAVLVGGYLLFRRS